MQHTRGEFNSVQVYDVTSLTEVCEMKLPFGKQFSTRSCKTKALYIKLHSGE